MAQKNILPAFAAAVLMLLFPMLARGEAKEVHIPGNFKTVKLSPNGQWVLDCGPGEVFNTLVNITHTMDLHFDKPSNTNRFDIECEKSYGEMDFSAERLYQYVIVDVKDLGNGKYEIKTKSNRSDEIDTEILTFDPVANTVSLNGGDPFWSKGIEYYPDGILAEITADNVNLRSGPGTQYPNVQFPYYHTDPEDGEKYPGGCASFNGYESERVIICPEFDNPDWYRIAIYNNNNEAFNLAWVSKRYCKPVLTEGIPHKKPKEIYVLANNEEPVDDELGCWEPSINLIFVFENDLCCRIDSYQSSISWGYCYPDQYMLFFANSRADFLQNRDAGISVNAGKDVVTVDIGKRCSIASVGIPETENWGYLPCMSFFNNEQIKKIFNDVIKTNPPGIFDIVLKEDLDNYKYYSIDIQ